MTRSLIALVMAIILAMKLAGVVVAMVASSSMGSASLYFFASPVATSAFSGIFSGFALIVAIVTMTGVVTVLTVFAVLAGELIAIAVVVAVAAVVTVFAVVAVVTVVAVVAVITVVALAVFVTLEFTGLVRAFSILSVVLGVPLVAGAVLLLVLAVRATGVAAAAVLSFFFLGLFFSPNS